MSFWDFGASFNTPYSGLLSDDDKRFALQQGLFSLGGGLLAAGAPTTDPGYSQAMMGQAFGGFGPAYSGALQSAGQNKLQQLQLQDYLAQRERDEKLQAQMPGLLADAGVPEHLGGLLSLYPERAVDYLMRERPKRETAEGADGYLYYLDDGSRVLPDVVKDPDLPWYVQQDDVGNLSINPAFSDYEMAKAAAGATNVTTNVDGDNRPQVGTIPQGWQLVETPDGAGWTMTPIPGGPADLEQQAAEEAKATGREQELRSASIVLEDIDRALNLAQTSEWPTTGFFGSLMSNVQGTDAYDLSELIGGIGANLSMTKLQELRNASTTGGSGLGQVTENEHKIMQDTYGSLIQSQSREQFLFNLQRLRDVYSAIVDGTNYEQVIGGQTMPPASTPTIDNDPLGLFQQ